jgi:hypothetical protein
VSRPNNIFLKLKYIYIFCPFLGSFIYGLTTSFRVTTANGLSKRFHTKNLPPTELSLQKPTRCLNQPHLQDHSVYFDSNFSLTTRTKTAAARILNTSSPAILWLQNHDHVMAAAGDVRRHINIRVYRSC